MFDKTSHLQPGWTSDAQPHFVSRQLAFPVKKMKGLETTMAKITGIGGVCFKAKPTIKPTDGTKSISAGALKVGGCASGGARIKQKISVTAWHVADDTKWVQSK